MFQTSKNRLLYCALAAAVVAVAYKRIVYGRVLAAAKEERKTEEKDGDEVVCPLSNMPMQPQKPEDEVFEWIQKGDEEKIWAWIDEEPSRVNHKEKRGQMSLLHVSVIFDQAEICAELLERGATVDSLESSALTPLHLACNEGYIECIKVLLKHGASLFAVNLDSSVKLGGSIPIYSSGGQSALHFAATSGSLPAVDLLLSTPNGEALIKRADFDGNTPSMLAMLKGYNEIAFRLEPSITLLGAEQRAAKQQQDYVVRAARISQRAGTLEALLRSSIQEKFIPRYPQLFHTDLDRLNFAPSFLTAYDHLLNQKDQQTPFSFGQQIAKGIYAFEFMTPEYCQRWIEEIENYEEQALQKGLPVRRPNSMNNYGLVLNDIGFAPVVDALRSEFLQPIMQYLFPILASQVRSHHTFAVKYKLGEDLDLGTHVDNSLITVNLSLGKSFRGGTLYFHGIAGEPNAEPQPYRDSHEERCQHCELVYDHKPGVAVIHVGKHIHGANRLAAGERVNLIIWFQP